jgi:hypothetical protein
MGLVPTSTFATTASVASEMTLTLPEPQFAMKISPFPLSYATPSGVVPTVTFLVEVIVSVDGAGSDNRLKWLAGWKEETPGAFEPGMLAAGLAKVAESLPPKAERTFDAAGSTITTHTMIATIHACLPGRLHSIGAPFNMPSRMFSGYFHVPVSPNPCLWVLSPANRRVRALKSWRASSLAIAYIAI